jgi:hypothetical protein
MAFDSMRGKLMVFGGAARSTASYKQDIWEWSGTDATLTNRTTGGTKHRRALPGSGNVLRQQAAIAFGCSAAPASRRIDDPSGTGRHRRRNGRWSPSAAAPVRQRLRHLDVLQSRARQMLPVRAERRAVYQNWEYDPR